MNKKALIEKMSGVMSAINRILPKDPDKIVFYSTMGFRDNVKAVYDELISHDCGKYQIVCAVSDWEDFENRPHPDNVRFVSPAAGVRHFFFGKYFFYSFGKYPVKPSKKQRVVNVWHGSPLKKIGNYTDDKDENFFTYVLAASDFFAPIMKKAFNCRDGQVKVCGHPRNDAMFKGENALRKLGLDTGWDKLILWMPTFRQSGFLGVSDAAKTEGTGLPILSRKEDMERVNELLREKNALLLAKIHPAQDLDSIDLTAYSNIRVVTNGQMQESQCDLYALLGQADGLITDYSSVYFDYLLLNRPIGFTVDDMEEYMKNRGFVVDDPRPLMPGQFLNTPEDFCGFLSDLLEGRDPYGEERLRVKELTNKYDDGKDALRALAIAGITFEEKEGSK